MNKNSPHYDKVGEKPNIQIIEEELTLVECRGWAKANMLKYPYRQDLKGQAESDREKRSDYERYLSFLIDVEAKIFNSKDEFITIFDIDNLSAFELYRVLNITIEYIA